MAEESRERLIARLSPLAESDFDTARRRYELESGERVSESFRRAFASAMKALVDFPEIGASMPESVDRLAGLRLRAPFTSTHVHYVRRGSPIEILRVLHESRDRSPLL